MAIATELSRQLVRLEGELDELLDRHPDAKVIRSIPGLGTKLAARTLGEFGDAPSRFADARSRKNYAGTSPITKASGRSHVVIARRTRNLRLADTCYQWAFTSISHSPGARTFYDQRRQRGDRATDILEPALGTTTSEVHRHPATVTVPTMPAS